MSRPSAARVYDWLLGGRHYLDVDREFGERVESVWPNIRPLARYNRAFLQRAVRDSVSAGISQFLDIGSGMPTEGAVHDIALAEDADAHIVYVDHDPVACTMSRFIVDQEGAPDRVAVVQGDLRRPDAILDHPDTLRLLDREAPVCLLMVAVVPFLAPQDQPAELIARFRDQLAPGSRLVLSHLACDQAPPEEARRVMDICRAYQDANNPLYCRDRVEIAGLFDGWDMIKPGVVFLPDWPDIHPADRGDVARTLAWCGVGQRPPR